MKTKVLCVILSILICISLLSCSSSNSVFGQFDKIGIGSSGEMRTKRIDSYIGYLAFTATTKLPDNFVYYKSVRKLGKFDSMVFLSDALINDYSWYMYSLIDDTGFEMVLYVRTDYKYEEKYNVLTSFKGTDMRKIEVSEKGTYMYYQKGVRYSYVQGKLSSLSWYAGDTYYTIGSGLADYPNVESTLLGKLLNLEKSDQAFADFMPEKDLHAFDDIISQLTSPDVNADEVIPQN